MKIKQLELAAFGPYLEKQILDFTELNEAELFLVTGDTGAGKTTIFDAICFALYGLASGDTRQIAQFRHQRADASQETYVKLTFEVRGHEYVVTRYPNYERAGYKTDSRHRAYLSGAEEKVIEGVNEVSARIKKIIGVDANEFRQVAMIAQGQFTRLIHTSSKEREAILRELFSTHDYALFQERLKKAEHELKAQYQTEQTRLEANLASFDEADKEHPIAYLTAKITDQQRAQAENKIKLADAIKKQESVGQTIEDALVLKQWLDEQEDLKRRMQEIDAKKKIMQEMQDQICLLEKVASCVEYDKQYQQANTHLQALSADQDAAKKEKADLENEAAALQSQSGLMQEREHALQKADEESRMVDEDLSKVEQYVKAENLARQAKKQEALLDEKIQRSLEQKKELETIMAKCEEDLKLFVHLEREQMNLAHESNYLDLKRQELVGLKEAKARLDQLEQTRQQQQEKWEAAIEKQRLLSDEQITLERQYQAAMAGILASQLEEGMPCPVCGSLHHPALATIGADDVTEETLHVHREKLATVQKEVQECIGALMGTKQIYDLEKQKYEQSLAGRSLEQLQADYQESVAGFEKAKQKNMQGFERQKQIQTYLTQFQEKYENWQTKHEQLNQQKQLAHENVVRRQEQFASLFASFNETFESMDVLLKRKSQLEKLKRDLTKQLEDYRQKTQDYSARAMQNQGVIRILANEYQKALHQTQKAKDDFQTALTAANLLLEDYRTQVEQLENLPMLKKEYHDYVYEKATAEKRQKELQEKIADRVIPDIEQLRAQKSALEKETQDLQIALEKSDWALSELAKQKQMIESCLKAYQDAKKRYQQVYEVSRLVSGQNPLRMTFESYILATYFEAILERANLRLTAMTDGRYALIRKDESQGGRALQGLDLNIMDYENGKPRDIRTLSGGETFKAALSLALGMADLISENAGGIELDTLFIDEGFGSLDERSLEVALDTLLSLKQEHKVVGIISHVSALKERVNAKIVVTHDAHSSFAHIE